ncbi:MAG TPA: HEAT repeat domain-containing protein [Gemmataceae bacterium]|nr:HEAT repeat domain-containing protein [Gemmataceae bacterium]
MSYARSLTALLGIFLMGYAWADTAARKATAPTVEQLIEQLASKDYQVREKASKALAGLGKESLAALQKARSHPDPEVRRRLDELIPPLERAVTLSPRPVTLHMTNKPVHEILSELSKQTGYKILTWPEAPPNGAKDKVVYTIHFDKLPFWQALDKVCEATGMTLQQGYWGDDAMRVYRQEAYVPFSCYNGPFKIIAIGFNYSRNNNFGQLPKNPGQQAAQQGNEFLNVSLQIATEPRLPILRTGQVKLSVAQDDEGHSMIPKAENPNNNMYNRGYYGFWRGYLHQVQAPLVWSSKSSRTVRTLKGTIQVTLLADQKPSIVTDKLLASKGKKFKVGDATFHVEEITEMPGKQYQIRLNVTENSKEAQNDWSRLQSMQQRLELQDDKGNKVPSYVNITNWGNGPMSAQFQIMVQPNNNAKVGAPAKLVYSSWVLMEHELAFEFKDLPLP